MGRKKTTALSDWPRALRVLPIAFAVAFLVAWPSQSAMRHLSPWLAFPILFFIILLGVLCDIIGVAVTVASEEPVHARSARRQPGAREGLWLIRRADRVANFCNDLVGDVAGTVSGAAAVAVVYRLAVDRPAQAGMLSLVAVAGVSAVTVGLKAFGKGLALREADLIIRETGRILYALKSLVGLGGRRQGGRA